MPCQAPCADGRIARVLGVVCLVWVQRTVQNNDNVKSEIKYLACARISNKCFLLLNSFSFFRRSIGFYLGQTSLLFVSELPAISCVSICLCTWICKIRTLRRASHTVLPFLHRPDICCVMHISDILPGSERKLIFRAWLQIQIDFQLIFLNVTNTYTRTYARTHIHCENRSLIQSFTLMHLAKI